MSIIVKKQRCPYPVGALIELTVGANPNTFWQGTTWAEHGTGRATIAIDAGQTEFNAIGKKGGAKSHVMTLGNLIVHTHNVPNITAETTSFNAGGGSEHSTNNGGAQGITSDATGSETPDAIPSLPPYVVVARWERTA